MSDKLNLPPDNNRYDPNTVYDVALDDIFSDVEFNVRGEITPLDVVELAKDIKERGLLQPIVIQPYQGVDHPECRFRIIAGHRRHLAHKVAEKTHIKAIIKVGMSTVDALSFNLIENIHRKDLNKWQEAQAIKRFMLLGLTENEVAKHIGKSRGWVQVRYMIVKLPYPIQEEISHGVLTDEQIRQCFALEDEEAQFDYVRRVKDAKLFGKDPNRIRNTYQKQAVKKPRSREEIFELQDTLRDLVGNGIETVICGWVAGETDDYDLHQAIRDRASDAGKFYQIPTKFKVKPDGKPEEAKA